MDHTSYLYITITKNKGFQILDSITLKQQFLSLTPSGKEKKKPLQRDKVGSQCSNINMTSLILSL